MRIGQFEVHNEIARGGMGVVYRAQSPTGEFVALKVLHRERASHPVARRRFLIELGVHARLKHPHVVGVRGVGEHAGAPWLALDYVEGESLESRLRRGPLAIEGAVELSRQLADALSYIHACGVLHRDLKPDNVLLQGDRALLTDFGLAHDDERSGQTRVTATGVFLGTPGYWAPEQARGDKAALGERTDVYGWGATLYACLTGQPPVQASSLFEFAETIRFRKVVAPHSLRPEVPRWLSDLCMRSLSLLPESRPDSAHALLEALAQHGGGAARSAPDQTVRLLAERIDGAEGGAATIVPALELRRSERGDPYLISARVEGEELTKLARGEPLPWEQSARIVRGLAAAVGELHARGAVHHDIAPQNVLLQSDGRTVLLDFRVANVEGLPHVIESSPAYSAPEQASGGDAGELADVYSLGAVLFFLLSGRAPYVGSAVEIMGQLKGGSPPAWPSERDPKVQLELEGVVKRAMRRDLTRRIASAEALCAELDACLGGEGRAETSERRATSPRLGLSLLAFALVAALVVLIGSWVLSGEPPAPEQGGEVGAQDPTVTSGSAAPRERGPPSVRARNKALGYRSVAQARESNPEALNSEVAYAVHYRNARQPLWTRTYMAPIADPVSGRQRPPHGRFVGAGETLKLVLGGGRKPRKQDGVVEPGIPRAWGIDSREEVPVMSEPTPHPVNVLWHLPDALNQRTLVLVGSLRRYTAFHSMGGAGVLDGAEQRLMGLSVALNRSQEWARGKMAFDRPVTASATRSDQRQFAFGTGVGGNHLRAGVVGGERELAGAVPVVVRVAFPMRMENGEQVEPSPLQTREVPLRRAVRALAYGPSAGSALWILGDSELYWWREDEVELRATGSDWTTLLLDQSGRPLVGGGSGLVLFDPLGKRSWPVELEGFSRVDGLARFDERYVLAVGSSEGGRGAWAVLELQEVGIPQALVSRNRGVSGYADVSVSEQARLACLTRWDGEFEVWDLDALLPWGEPRQEAERGEAGQGEGTPR